MGVQFNHILGGFSVCAVTGGSAAGISFQAVLNARIYFIGLAGASKGAAVVCMMMAVGETQYRFFTNGS
jgi:hypothetical protein